MVTGLPRWSDTVFRYYPTYQIESGDDEYECINWLESTPIPKSVLEAYRFIYAKELKINEFKINCDFTIEHLEFTSSALGAPYKYKSDVTSQINLIGAVIATSPLIGVVQPGYQISYPVVLVSTEEFSYELHTFTQLRTVIEDLSLFKLGWYETFNTLRLQVPDATTIEELDALVWPGLDAATY